MSTRPDRVTVLRWTFLLTGLFLLFGGGVIIGFRDTAQQLSEVLFPDNAQGARTFRIFANLLPLTASVCCLITSRGIRLGRSWARATGICASFLVIGLLSWLSLAGFACLWGLATPLPRSTPPDPAPKSKDYWLAKRKSLAQRVVVGIIGLFGLAGFSWVRVFAWRAGMRSWDPGLWSLPVLLLADVTVHELGHVAMAWAMHNRLRVVNIGPFTFQDAGHGFHFHFDPRRLFGGGGFVSSASQTGEDLRWKLVAEIAGGPAAAMLGALVSAATFLSLRGTSLQVLWWIPGFLMVLFLFDAVINLIPLGFCDGSMLLHLILWTPGGRLLIGRSFVQHTREEDDHLRGRAEFDKAVELWQKPLEQAVAGGELNAFTIAFCEERLGYAYFSLHDWPAAEARFRQCLEWKAECAAETAFLVNSLSGLQRALGERHHVLEFGRVYAQAIAALEKRRKNRDKLSRSVLGIMIAWSHFCAHAFDKALEETGAVLRMLPAGRDRLLLRAEALCVQARAQFALGATAAAYVSAAEGAEILRSAEIPAHDRNMAWHDLAEFAEGLWVADQAEMAIEWLREAIAGLQAGSATITAAMHRIRLASVLRQTERHAEAWQCLPDPAELPDCTRRELMRERARLSLATGKAADAVSECEALLALGEADPVEMALTRSLLAEACLEAGDHQRAAELAHEAAEILGPWQHCEMATCLVTTALAQWRCDGAWLPEYVDRARQLIESDCLLHTAEKRRMVEAQARRCRSAPLDVVPNSAHRRGDAVETAECRLTQQGTV